MTYRTSFEFIPARRKKHMYMIINGFSGINAKNTPAGINAKNIPVSEDTVVMTECSHCSAPVTKGHQEFCKYCGSKL